jgi:hypothetical protein
MKLEKEKNRIVLAHDTFLIKNIIFFILDLVKMIDIYYLGANEGTKPVFASSLSAIFANSI